MSLENPPQPAASQFRDLVWQPDRMLWHDLVFRLEHTRSADWELGDACFVFYKTKALVDQYAHFFATLPNFAPQHVAELGVWDGGSLAFWFELFQPAKLVGFDIQSKSNSRYLSDYVAQRRLAERLVIHWETDQANVTQLSTLMASEFDA